MNTKHLLFAMALVLATFVPGAALAQDDSTNPFDLDGDVDQDGAVGVTDVQHVINRALGLPSEDPNAAVRPIRKYVLASPRASLIPIGEPAQDAGVPCESLGEAANFPRRQGSIVVRQGHEVLFELDRNIEGVWYPGACGAISTQIILEGAEIVGGEPTEFVPVGRNGAAARRCGPHVATARVGVPYRFNEAGEYVLRARIVTHAVPAGELPEPPAPEGEPTPPEGEPAAPEGEHMGPGPMEGENAQDPNSSMMKQMEDPNIEDGTVLPQPLCGAVAVDDVFVRIRVVAGEPGEGEVRQFQNIPEDVMGEFGSGLPRNTVEFEEPMN